MGPFFSIVIPTRDRPHLVVDALYSAVNQDFDDFEVILSDNSTDGRTYSVFIEFYDSLPPEKKKRLRYVRTPRPLDMCLNWDFALKQAKGRWISFLADDDYMLANTLSIGFQIIKKYEKEVNLIQFRTASFNPYSNKLVVPNINYPFIILLNARKQFVIYFERLHDAISLFPKPHFSLVSSSLYDILIRKYGSAFIPWAPDVSFAFLFLYNAEKYIYVDLPMIIYGQRYESYGYGALGNKEKLKEFLSQFEICSDKDCVADFSPIKNLYTVSNFVFDTMMRTLNKIAETEGKKADDIITELGISKRDMMRRYFITNIQEIERAVSNGSDEYKLDLIRIKLIFYIWKMKEFLKGVVSDRGYVKDVLLSRARKILGKWDSGSGAESYDLSKNDFIERNFQNIKEAGDWLSSFVSKQVSKYGLFNKG